MIILLTQKYGEIIAYYEGEMNKAAEVFWKSGRHPEQNTGCTRSGPNGIISVEPMETFKL
jgi:hypothetical protein